MKKDKEYVRRRAFRIVSDYRNGVIDNKGLLQAFESHGMTVQLCEELIKRVREGLAGYADFEEAVTSPFKFADESVPFRIDDTTTVHSLVNTLLSNGINRLSGQPYSPKVLSPLKLHINDVYNTVSLWTRNNTRQCLWGRNLLNIDPYNILKVSSKYSPDDFEARTKLFDDLCNYTFDEILELKNNANLGTEFSKDSIFYYLKVAKEYLAENDVRFEYENGIPDNEYDDFCDRCLKVVGYDEDRKEKRPIFFARLLVALYFYYGGRQSIFLKRLKENPNLFDINGLNWMLEQNFFSEQAMRNAGFDMAILGLLRQNQKELGDDTYEKLDKIKNVSTEVYFWGLPNSGKTCMIGALLKAIWKNGQVVAFDEECQGYHYMTELRDVFNLSLHNLKFLTVLPPRTNAEHIYEMSFVVDDKKSIFSSPSHITFLDMAGEKLKDMANFSKGGFSDEKLKNKLKRFEDIYFDEDNNNHRMHIFVVDHTLGKYERDGLSQKDWLAYLIEYMKCKDKPLIDGRTDLVYVVFTKMDELPPKPEGESLEDFYHRAINDIIIQQDLKQAVINPLKELSDKYGFEFKLVPFKLGKLYFKRICEYDPLPSVALADNIIPKCYKRGIRILRKLKSINNKPKN